ncbi:hypothetical protein [Niallia sp. 01092]|uniref:hypothetical protein n=1 Tax=unclassified Niallia TaxID=2837522 RepID=UPI003FD0BD9C
MSERLVYSVLKRINDGDVGIISKDYRMPDRDFNQFISLLNSNGYIDQSSLTKVKLTIKGLEFLKENKRFDEEIPESIKELPQWVRYAGAIYK